MDDHTIAPGTCLFKSIRELGTGGLGTVDLIEITRTNQYLPVGSQWARKQLNQKFKGNPVAQERFNREIDAIKRMNHPAIISFKGENMPGKERFYAMPYYKGSLRDYIRANKNGAYWKDVAGFASSIADALHHAHQNGFYHRDIKPENILLNTNNTPVVSDWGLGYFVHQNSLVLDLTLGGIGTLYYCSAEQWNTGKCTESGDIYSLGVVIAEACRGANRIAINRPGDGITVNVVSPVSPAEQQFNDLLKWMTAFQSHARPQTMDVVKRELTRISSI